VNSNGPHFAHGNSVTAWWPKWPRSTARRATLRHGHRAPRGLGGTSGEGSPAAELWRGGRREHRRVTDDPPGKVKVVWAHRAGTAPWRQWSDRARQHLTVMEVCGRRW
jgi:hypothetical protein